MHKGTLAAGIQVEQLREALIESAPRLRALIQGRLPKHLRGRISDDDILQEVWIAAYRNRSGFRMDRPDAIDRWLTSIAQSRLLNSIKMEMRLKRGGGERFVDAAARSRSYVDLFARVASPGDTPSHGAALTEAAVAIRLALAEMPEARREAVVYRYIEGKTCDEIAKKMKRSKPSVNSLLFNGLRQLQELIGPAWRYLSDAKSSENLGVFGDAAPSSAMGGATKELRRR